MPLLPIEKAANAIGDNTIKLAVVGCGRRGTAAALHALLLFPEIRIVALADLFQDRLAACAETLRNAYPINGTVDAVNQFLGFRAYHSAIAEADAVILAAPPAFHPDHFAYAVAERKHVFLEVPVAVDAPGINRINQAAIQAKNSNLVICSAFEKRQSEGYKETVARLMDGAIGEIKIVRAWANAGPRLTWPRTSEETEMEYQIRNWYYFSWLSGDFLLHALTHGIDAINWLRGDKSYQLQSCYGIGGCQVRTGKQFGNIFDHHTIHYRFSRDSMIVRAQCREIAGCDNRVGEEVIGTSGRCEMHRSLIQGNSSWEFKGAKRDLFEDRINAFISAIKNNESLNDAESAASSTMWAILGRMASYSGKLVNYSDGISRGPSLFPLFLGFDEEPPVLPLPNGEYPRPIPGTTAPF